MTFAMPDSSIFLTYLLVFIGPFIQEDAAVIGAASLSTNEMTQTIPIFLTILTGLILSDIWKYWIGWAAMRNERARNFVEKRHISSLKGKVERNIIATLFTARFLPLARIPTYVACGLFKINYLKFCLIVSLTAFTYVVTIFTMCHVLGEVMGEQFKWVVPIIALTGLIIYILIIKWRNDRTSPNE